jgi:hypothetical protein
MKKVTLIGDCHSARVLEHHNPESCPVIFQSWGKGGNNAWQTDPFVWAKENHQSAGTEDIPLYILANFETKMYFKDIKDQDLILPWLGYVDVRQMLPGHDDADFVVKQYVDRFVKYFAGSEVRFIEPHPQFIPLFMKFPGLHPEYTFEQRLEQNNTFIESLRKYSDEHGLKKPISQEQIFEAMGFGQDEMTEDKTDQPGPHPFDKLKKKYVAKIYELIISEAAK